MFRYVELSSAWSWTMESTCIQVGCKQMYTGYTLNTFKLKIIYWISNETLTLSNPIFLGDMDTLYMIWWY